MKLWQRMFTMAAPGGSRGRLSILIFHRVRPAIDPLFPGEPDASQFAALLAHLRSRFQPIGLLEGVRRLYDGTLPPRAIAVTFDDGYADNLTVAAPLLRTAGVPATVFVAAGYLDGGIMWNDRVIEACRLAPARLDLEAAGLGVVTLDSVASRSAAASAVIGKLKYLSDADREQRSRAIEAAAGVAQPASLMLTRAQLRALAGDGIEIGAHTMSHPILARLDVGSARAEIHDSKACLEGILQSPVALFAYPNGRPHEDYRPEHVRMVREAGFEAAVSTAWGSATATTDRYQLPRFTPWARSPLKFDLLMLRNLRAAVVERVAA